MNVFVLSTGRCGSTTFAKAASHISNFTSAHELRLSVLGSDHLDYPDNHIELDNRLSWFLGRLDKKYGNQAFYVHLKRDRMATALSYARSYKSSRMMAAYAKGLHLGLARDTNPLDVALDYYDTVNENVVHFIKDKNQKMNFRLENAKRDWVIFWKCVGAIGDASAALGEWEIAYNKSKYELPTRPPRNTFSWPS